MTVRERRPRPRTLALAYGAWLLGIGLSALAVWIWRSDLLGLLLLTRVSHYLYALLDEVTFLFLALGWLMFVILSEAWQRRGASKGSLREQNARLGGVLTGLIAVGALVYFLGL